MIGPALAANRDTLLPLREQLAAAAAEVERSQRLTSFPPPALPSFPVNPTVRNTAELVRISSESLRVASEQQEMMAALVAEVQASAQREVDAAKGEARRFRHNVILGVLLVLLGVTLSRLLGG